MTGRPDRVAAPRRRVGDRLAMFAESPAGVAFAVGWGFAEALSWPVIAEMELAFVAGSSPRALLPHAAGLTAGSVAGVVTHAAVRRGGITLPAPLTTTRMVATARQQLLDDGPAAAFRAQRFNWIPVKVYAAQAGDLRLSLVGVARACAPARGSRILPIGAAGFVASLLASPIRRRTYGAWMVLAGAGWAFATRRVVNSWR